MGISRELRSLGALEIGVEDESALIEMLQQHHADIGMSGTVCRGERHGIRIVRLAALGFRVPLTEQREWLIGRRMGNFVRLAAHLSPAKTPFSLI